MNPSKPQTPEPAQADTFEQLRPYLFAIAYRMLGTAMEAEDILQDAYLRYLAAAEPEVISPKAYLSTIVTRLCINHLNSAKVQREQQAGPWLPEPIRTEAQSHVINPAEQLDAKETISMAFLVLLESLTPTERAVFLLREVFDYSHADIAQILDKSEANCRQLFRRAKRHIVENRPRFQSTPETHQQMLTLFMNAIEEGELSELTRILASDVMLVPDGGGVPGSITRALHGVDVVSRFLLGVVRFAPPNYLIDIAELNGQPAAIMRYSDGRNFLTITLGIEHNLICEIYAIANPTKLQSL